MPRRHAAVAGAAALAAALIAAGGGPARGAQKAAEPPPRAKTTAETIREKVGGAVESVRKGAAGAGEAVRQRYASARESVSRMGVEARVYARLHWDRDLFAAAIDLTSPKNGTIVLEGNVAGEKLRSKAVTLARETLGVEEVVDHLTVGGGPGGPKPSNGKE